MKIFAKMEYACVVMLELASHHASVETVRLHDIAERHGASPRFPVQILLQSKGAGLVSSVRGAAGGYRLAGSPVSILAGSSHGRYRRLSGRSRSGKQRLVCLLG